ncbi:MULTISPECIES: hypothetical protein [Staphylococcus]|uniref:DUF3188 domain-containing protein n=1 Tax=Staphylococcus xylosus TaxID=1288 RepID=A0A418IRB1_STAXY|nr:MULTISPECIES: hypothetical protein [Staphylococcus]MBF0812849.1 hypothetical protein [Staphylococcus saprophyticus]MDW8544092.1 hypothetical protein [Staphylococcus sp. KG4-1]MRF37469.1 hypothetical protein [Staphylococcus sp. KY49P]MDW8561158.1 hypothetical protein [Staphylococcus sp. KG4-3]NQD98324.1 hypothetical protein [Staphylococcus xylosus]
MKHDRLTHVLLLISGLLLLLNGGFAFEKSTPMLIVSSFLIVFGIVVIAFALKLFINSKNSSKSNTFQDS